MYKEKRKRTNWLPSEKNLLMELVEKRLSIIENKKIDTVAIKRKLEEWQIISNEYNSQTTNSSRSGEELKRHWESMKKNARKEENDRKIKIRTGGRPEDYPKKEDPIHLKILSLIKKGAALFTNHIDSNNVAAESSEKFFFEVILPEDSALCSKDPETDVDILENGVDSNEAVIQDWSDYTPKLLKTPVTSFKSNNKGQERNLKETSISRSPSISTSDSSSSFENMHENKTEANTSQKRVANKEKLYLNEAHKIDLQIKREQLKQEKIRTRILLLDYYRMKKKMLNTK